MTDVDPVRAVVLKHCRTYPNGSPVWCRSSHAERVARAEKSLRPLPRRVIYDSKEQAEACARELVETCGWRPQRAYACHRSAHGHHHLTSDVPRQGKGSPRRLDPDVAP